MKHDMAAVGRLFELPDAGIEAESYGTGHINDTYLATVGDRQYIMQRLNKNVFKQPELLMDNMARVCDHLARKYAGAPDAARRSIHLVKARSGRMFAVDADGEYWRCYHFIGDARTYDVIESTREAFQAARAFGAFQLELADMPGARLYDTIPDFHNTPKRLAALENAIAADAAGRLKSVAAEVDFIRARAGECSLLIELNAKGEIPERITHNDTKLNNVLIDLNTHEGICVIDLDTVMPGLAHYDFGDMVRTGTSPAPEDERDLAKVTMRFEMFEALLRGYLEGAGRVLNATERHYLPFAGKLITLEIGTRFLTDYLEGDRYFKVHREGHNLDRCRTQLKLVQSIEEQFPAMMRLLESIR